MTNMRNAASALVVSSSIIGFLTILLMVPTSGVFADDLINPKPNNIPTWGPTWCDNKITYRIDNISKLLPVIQMAMEKGVTEWARHAPTNPSGEPLQLDKADPGTTPDIILKYKKGGGRVQGHALQQNDGVCFTQVKITVSGKAFGSDSSAAQVQSIAMQEVGHGLGLLHSDNKKDVMYGLVQSNPNVLLSECDIAAWELVMKWYVDGDDPYAPGSETVTCEDAGTGGGGGTDQTATYATVQYKSKGGRMAVTVTLLDEKDGNNVNVPGIEVKIKLSGDNGSSYTGTKTTDDSGNAKWNFVGVKAGTYTTVVLEVDGESWTSVQTKFNSHTK